jgi:hypothetical protein
VVTTPIATPSGDRAGLLSKLMATVRSEFRADVLVFAADDPVFGGGACRVAGCERSARGSVTGRHARPRHRGAPAWGAVVPTRGPPRRRNGRGCWWSPARPGWWVLGSANLNC